MKSRAALQEQSYRRSMRKCVLIFYCGCSSGGTSAARILVAGLQEASRAKDLASGRRIHGRAIGSGEISNVFVATTVVDMYGRLGAVSDAQRVFDGMEHRSVVSWAVLVSGYAQHGQEERALAVMEGMQDEGFQPHRAAYLAALKACTGLASKEEATIVSGRPVKIESLQRVKKIRSKVGGEKNGDIVLENSLIDAYSRCGSMPDAQQVFDRMPSRAVVAWTTIILGYAQNGEGDTALLLFSVMLLEGCSPDRATFLVALKACSGLASRESGKEQTVKIKALAQGTRVHSEAAKRGYDSDVFVANALVDMYGKCGSMVFARRVFDRMPGSTCVSWTSMILGYAQNGDGEEALLLFAAMQHEGCPPDAPAFIAALQACGCLAESEESTLVDGGPVKTKALERGMYVHSLALSSGWDSDVFVANSLVDMYAKCGSLLSSRRVFDTMKRRSVVSWTALVLGHAQLGQGEEALRLFSLMQSEGCEPNALTFVAALQGCSALTLAADEKNQLSQEVLDKIVEVDCQATRSGHGLDAFVASTLIEVYGKCGSLSNASRVFDRTQHSRSVVSWAALLSAYARNGEAKTTLQLFALMQLEGCPPNAQSFVAALKACGSLTLLEAGRRIHSQLSSCGLDRRDLVLANSLVDFYGKCGSMAEAREVFDAIADKGDAVAWSALIEGYSRQGNTQEVFDLFGRMVERDLRPDGVTFLSVLAACSHTGMIDRGREVLWMMRRCGVHPRIEHYQCVIDLFGRGNRLDWAMEIANGMPFENTDVTWTALLSPFCKY